MNYPATTPLAKDVPVEVVRAFVSEHSDDWQQSTYTLMDSLRSA